MLLTDPIPLLRGNTCAWEPTLTQHQSALPQVYACPFTRVSPPLLSLFVFAFFFFVLYLLQCIVSTVIPVLRM